MKVGWLVDDPGYVGGAERSMAILKRDVPDGVEIVDCPTGNVASDVDCYVVGNCVQYTADIIPKLVEKPVYKIVWDIWPHGDEKLKNWLLSNATVVILATPGLRDYVKTEQPVKLIPSPVDWRPFEAAVQRFNGEKSGALWLGNTVFAHKGLGLAVQWAEEAGVTLDVYGPGSLKGTVEYDAIPDLMATYETFVFLPTAYDPCPRTTIEAWYAGCKLVVNSMVGSRWWFDNDPAALENASADFWQTIVGGHTGTAPTGG